MLPEESPFNFRDAAVYNFTENNFFDNTHAQPFIKQSMFRGSLLLVESETKKARIHLLRNKVRENIFLGEDSAFFYIKGASVSAIQNWFMRNGFLGSDEYRPYNDDAFALVYPEEIPYALKQPVGVHPADIVGFWEEREPEAPYFPINIQSY